MAISLGDDWVHRQDVKISLARQHAPGQLVGTLSSSSASVCLFPISLSLTHLTTPNVPILQSQHHKNQKLTLSRSSTGSHLQCVVRP